MYKSLNNNSQQKFLIWLIQIRNASKSNILYNKKQPNYYEILGVPRKATSKELKLAYYKKCQQLHPDKNKDDPQSHQKFVILNQAYSTLIDPHSRSKYDLTSTQTQSPPNSTQYTYYNNEYYSRNNYYHDYYTDRMREEKMRYDAHYRRYYKYPNSNHDFKTPSHVILLVAAITITIFMFDALFVNYTYQKDIHRMHEYYSPINKQTQKELKTKMEKKLSKEDEDEIDEQIRQFKKYEETPVLRVYKTQPKS